MTIHVLGTVNGIENEGMRNVATHLARSFEKGGHTVLYSGLRQIPAIIQHALKSDATIVFARANQQVYWLVRMVTLLCKNVWIVCVQKPEAAFRQLNDQHPLKCSYLTIIESDVADIKLSEGKVKQKIGVGINAEKFAPVSAEQARRLKQKYGFDPEKPLVIHVGHCSRGRGLEDLIPLQDAQRMVVASGMFEDASTVQKLEQAGVRIHKGFLENVEEIYQMADVYLFPTRSTEFVISIPLSVMEALASGTPVIGYRSFANLTEIKCDPQGIAFIDDCSDIPRILADVAKMKQNRSYLQNAKTWDAIAADVLRFVEGVNT